MLSKKVKKTQQIRKHERIKENKKKEKWGGDERNKNELTTYRSRNKIKTNTPHECKGA